MARARQMQLSQVVADGLVERELLGTEAGRLHLTVTAEEVDGQLFNGFILVSVPSDNPQLAASVGAPDGADQRVVVFRDPKTHEFSDKLYGWRSARSWAARRRSSARNRRASCSPRRCATSSRPPSA